MALTPIEITFSIFQPTLIFLGQIVGESSLVSMSENSTTDDSAEIAIAAGGMLKKFGYATILIILSSLALIYALFLFSGNTVILIC